MSMLHRLLSIQFSSMLSMLNNMRAKLLLALLIAGGSLLSAQPHYISIGLRGGAGTFLTKGSEALDIHNIWEPAFMLDANYSHLWQVQPVQLGITTGLGFGYVGGGYKASAIEQYTNIDYLGHPIEYTNTVTDIYERTHGFAMEIPALFALHWQGLVLHAGLRLQIPLWYRCKQSIDNVSISAYYPEYDVTLVDEVITGYVPKDEYGSLIAKRDVADFSLLLSMDIGYEWQLTSADWLGLSAYIDGAPYSHPAGKQTARIIDVAPISDPSNPPAEVTVNTLIGAGATHMNYIACGVKLTYRFDVLQHLPNK